MGYRSLRQARRRWLGRPGGKAKLALLASVAAAPLLATGAAFPAPPAVAQAGGSPSLAVPSENVPRTPAIQQACTDGSSAACQQAVVAAIDAARAAEGVKPLQLPGYYDSLTVPEQLLVLADLERVDRGLPGFAGLSSQLDSMALQGAVSNNDPNGPGDATWGSNWAGGEGSALLADFDWMYDDGPGSPNLDCTSTSSGGCWDHRLNVLGDYGPGPSMGAAFTKVDGVTSLTELFSSSPAGQLDYRLPSAAPAAQGTAARPLPRTAPAGGSRGYGYWQATSNGAVLAFGASAKRGSAAAIHLAKPVVGLAATPDGRGYWEVAADGGVFSFGDARFYGSAATLHLPGTVVGMAVARRGAGYWLVTRNGGVYSFGSAHFYGTPVGGAGGAVVGIASTPDGRGYWLATSYGNVFSFGDARFYGPRALLHLHAPVVGVTATEDGHGYWLVTKQGSVYAFGDARYSGSAFGWARDEAVGIAASPDGHGYYITCADGRVLPLGGAPMPSGAGRVAAGREMAGLELPGHVVGMATA
jgi:hypothetical protein